MMLPKRRKPTAPFPTRARGLDRVRRIKIYQAVKLRFDEQRRLMLAKFSSGQRRRWGKALAKRAPQLRQGFADRLKFADGKPRLTPSERKTIQRRSEDNLAQRQKVVVAFREKRFSDHTKQLSLSEIVDWFGRRPGTIHADLELVESTQQRLFSELQLWVSKHSSGLLGIIFVGNDSVESIDADWLNDMKTIPNFWRAYSGLIWVPCAWVISWCNQNGLDPKPTWGRRDDAVSEPTADETNASELPPPSQLKAIRRATCGEISDWIKALLLEHVQRNEIPKIYGAWEQAQREFMKQGKICPSPIYRRVAKEKWTNKFEELHRTGRGRKPSPELKAALGIAK